jgi:hypothetical protein
MNKKEQPAQSVPRPAIDLESIKADWVANKDSIEVIAKRYSLTPTRLCKLAAQEQWFAK